MIEVAGYGAFPHQLPGMHDNSGMSAAQITRMPPGNSLRTLHPLPHELQHTSVIKKLDHSIESFIPSNKSNPTNHNLDSVTNRPIYHQTVPEVHFADDDFSDHDSHYSEDFEDDIDIEYEENDKPDITNQLLDFASMVSTDIQKFFGRKKGDDDSCDIYEDKWKSTKSGRELYYADLMKIVQGEDKAGKDSSSPLLDISNSASENKDNRNTFSGKLDKKLGVGPLNELFEYGLRHFMTDKKLKHSKEIKRLKSDAKRYESLTPMQNRKLPTSFFREPGVQQGGTDGRTSNSNTNVLQTNNPPDFSDLLESWRLDRNEFNGDMSSSEVSMSPESV